jgi:hypothetical protein
MRDARSPPRSYYDAYNNTGTGREEEGRHRTRWLQANRALARLRW